MPTGKQESRPSLVRALEKELLATARSLRSIASGLAALADSMNQVAEDLPRLGQKPLVVLTKGQRRKGMEFLEGAQERHRELPDDSDWRIISGAGHSIHQDEPDVVVDAIRQVVESARLDQALAIPSELLISQSDEP